MVTPLRRAGNLALALLAIAATGVEAGERWTLRCTAWGGSHTSRMTFEVSLDPCRIHWRELGLDLAIERCRPPVIVAIKPYALTREDLLHFDLETGGFVDQLGAVEERGRCVRD